MIYETLYILSSTTISAVRAITVLTVTKLDNRSIEFFHFHVVNASASIDSWLEVVDATLFTIDTASSIVY